MVAASRDLFARRPVEIESKRLIVEVGAAVKDKARQRPKALADPIEASLLGVEARLKLVMSDQVALKASRPVYSALSVDKLAAAGFHMPEWRDALRRWLAMRATPHAGVSA